MKHTPLDIYDDMPSSMRRYISNFGWHFNKKACEHAVSRMKHRNPSTGKLEAIEFLTKDQVENLLIKYGIKFSDYVLYDAIYVANMAKADYYKSSIADDSHLAMFVKDTLDDPDGCDELPFRYWLQRCIALGEPVDFEDFM